MTAEEQNREEVDAAGPAGAESGGEADARGSTQRETTRGPGEERMRVLRMLSEGKVSAEEAEELLAAVEPALPGDGSLRPGERSPAEFAWDRRGPRAARVMFGPQGMFGPHGIFGPSDSGLMGRWEPPDRPGSPAPPPPPPSAPSIIVPPPPPRTTAKSRAKADLSLAFEVKDGGKEMNAALPLTLAHAADRFLPRQIRQYLKRYEVDLGQLLEVAEATDDEAIGVDGLELFHVKEGQVVLTVTLQRAL